MMSLAVPLLLLLQLLQREAVEAAEASGTPCPGYNVIPTVVQNGDVDVCFQVIGGVVGAFRLTTDKFTLLDLHMRTFSQSTNSRINVQIGSAISIDHDYVKGNRVVPFFAVSVVSRNGVVEKIEFDDTTAGCDAANIVGTSCSVDVQSCATNDCSPKVYVGWIGTDSEGNILTSASLRPSRFMAYSSTGTFDKLSSVI